MDPVAFNPFSADRMRVPDNPFIGYDLIKGQSTNSTALTSNTTGFLIAINISLSALNLDLIIPEIEVYYRSDTSLGGGISQRFYKRLPFITIDTSGNVSERAQYNVSFQYDNTKGFTPLTATTYLQIEYYNRTSSSAGQIFDYKIKSSRAQTISTSGLGQ
jgi:hypothetical protein